MKLSLYITCAWLLFFQFTSNAQDAEELTQQLKTVKSDTAKLRILVELTDVCELNEIEQLANQAIALADKLLQQKKYDKNSILILKATAINNLAFLNHTLSKSEKGVLEYHKSFKIFEEVNDTNGIIMSCNNIAMLEKDLGHMDITFRFLDRSLDLALKSNNLEILQMTHPNYSSMYVKLGLINEA